MIKPIEVRAIKKYELYVRFNDGVEGVVDLSHLKKGKAFEYWQRAGNFEKVYIDDDSIAWNENLDIDALNIYLKLTKQTFKKIAPLQ